MVSSTQLEEMRGKLIEVAEDLAVPIEEAARPTRRTATWRPDEPGQTPATRGRADASVDPRYEDLWVHKDESLQIPDLASIDLEFDESEE